MSQQTEVTGQRTMPPTPLTMPQIGRSVIVAEPAAAILPNARHARNFPKKAKVISDRTPAVITHMNIPKETSTSLKESHIPDWHLASEPSGARWRNPWWLLWWLYGHAYIYKLRWVPIPHYWGWLASQTRHNHGRVWDLSQLAVSVYAVVSRKGGRAKTSLTTWLASNASYHTDGTTIIIDGDSGSKGDAAARLNINMEEAPINFEQVKQLILTRFWRPTNRELSGLLPRDPFTGVRILAPTDVTNVSRRNMKTLITHLRPCGSLWIDTTPGSKEQSTWGVWDMARIVSVACMFDTVDVARSINIMRDEESDKITRFSERLKEGTLFIVASDVPRGKFNRRTQYELAEKLGVATEQVILLPYDRHLKREGEVRWHLASPLFRYALSDQNRILAEAAARDNAKHPIANPIGKLPEGAVDVQIDVACERLIGLTGSQSEAAKSVLSVKYRQDA